jgi:CheY-like chemotaxis protein
MSTLNDSLWGFGSAMTETRVLVVDDEADMRDLLRTTIEIANNGLSVSGVAEDGDTAVAQWRQQRPEVVLLDQSMPKMSGLEAAQRILTECPDQKIILFTAYLDDMTGPRMFRDRRRGGIPEVPA